MNTTLRRSTVVTLLAATALTVPTAAFATGGQHTTAERACSAPLPASVQGKPALKPGADAGQYIGHDGKGWTLFVTHPLVRGADGKPVKGQTRTVFSGRITSTKAIHWSPRRLEKHDQVFLSRDRRTLLFHFNNYGWLDGLRFTTGCSAAVSFALNTDKARTAVTDIHLGSAKVNPATNPFTITRTAPATTGTATS